MLQFQHFSLLGELQYSCENYSLSSGTFTHTKQNQFTLQGEELGQYKLTANVLPLLGVPRSRSIFSFTSPPQDTKQQEINMGGRGNGCTC